jgi:hypothetical protein
MLTGIVIVAASLIYATAARTLGEQNLSTVIYMGLVLSLIALNYLNRRHRER